MAASVLWSCMCPVISKIGFGSKRVGWMNSPMTDVFPSPLLPPIPIEPAAQCKWLLFASASTIERALANNFGCYRATWRMGVVSRCDPRIPLFSFCGI